MTKSDSPLAVVTGGARGIGFATCERLLATGNRVALLDVDGARGAEATNRLGPGARPYSCDVSDATEVQAVSKAILDEMGECTHLVANVGWTPEKLFLDLTATEQSRIIEVNYSATLHCTRQFLPSMIHQGKGRLVFVSSDAARAGVAGEAVYAGAKAALIGFAKSLALEVARQGVTVNVVSPGSTETELLETIFSSEQIEKRKRIHPMRRLAQPSDVAKAIAFFCSDDAEFITGQVLSVNGGMLRAG